MKIHIVEKQYLYQTNYVWDNDNDKIDDGDKITNKSLENFKIRPTGQDLRNRRQFK